MDYKTELIKQLEELEAENTQHPSFYAGYGFAISDAIETIKKFNYIPCCKSDSEQLGLERKAYYAGWTHGNLDIGGNFEKWKKK